MLCLLLPRAYSTTYDKDDIVIVNMAGSLDHNINLKAIVANVREWTMEDAIKISYNNIASFRRGCRYDPIYTYRGNY